MEQDHKEVLRLMLPYLCKTIDPQHLLPQLPCLSMPSREEIQATQNNKGRYQAVMDLHDHLIRRPCGWNQLLDALRSPEVGQADVADQLDPPEKEEPTKTEVLHADRPRSHHHFSDKRLTSRDKWTSKAKFNQDTPWSGLTVGVREILKQLDLNQGADKLAVAFGITNKEYNLIIAHKAENSLAIALIENWNNSEEATLGKILAILKQIERIDVLRELEEFTGVKLPDDVDQSFENYDRSKVSDKDSKPQANRQASHAARVDKQASLGSRHSNSVKADGQSILQVLRSSRPASNFLPEPNRPLIMDRSLSVVDTHPVLKPQAVVEVHSLPEKIMPVSRSESPYSRTCNSHHSNGCYLDEKQVTCIHQESQPQSSFIPVARKDKCQRNMESCPGLSSMSQSSDGEDDKSGEESQMMSTEANSRSREEASLFGNPYTAPYTSNVEVHILSEDSLNNNNSDESTLTYPSLNDIRSIRRVEMVDSVNNGSTGEQEISNADDREAHYRVIGEKTNEDVINNMSCIERYSEGSLGQNPQGYSSELSSIMRKADKCFPGLQPTVDIDVDELDDLNSPESFSDGSLASCGDNSLNAESRILTYNDDNTMSEGSVNSIGVTLEDDKISLEQQEAENRNCMPRRHDEGSGAICESVIENTNAGLEIVASASGNLNMTVGQVRSDTDNDTKDTEEEEESLNTSQSLLMSALTAIYNEADLLPWKHLLGGAAAVALFMAFKGKE